MFIWKATQLRAPAYPQSTRYVDAQGTQHTRIPMELLEEIECPVQRESDETHFNQEIDEYPYLRVEPKSQEQIDAQNKAKALAELTALETTHLLPRVTREFLIAVTVQQAAALGLTVTQLLDANDPAFSPGFKKMWDFNEQTKVLRGKL